MGCPKLTYYPNHLRVFHSKYKENYLPQKEQAPLKIYVAIWRVSPENDLEFLGVYAYVLNNPLKYTDPDGEWVHLVVGAVIGGTINWLANGARFDAKGLG